MLEVPDTVIMQSILTVSQGYTLVVSDMMERSNDGPEKNNNIERLRAIITLA